MGIVELAAAKRHLNIDLSFTIDDNYISDLINVAEVTVSNYINVAICELGDPIPFPVVQAILLLVGNLYANREPVTFGSPQKVPLTFDFLLEPYIHY